MQRHAISKLANNLMTKHGANHYSFNIRRLYQEWPLNMAAEDESIAHTDPYIRVIEFNELYMHLPDNEIRLTLLHEIAHVITIDIFGTFASPHGSEWQRRCLAIGGDGLATWGHKSDILTKARNDFLNA